LIVCTDRRNIRAMSAKSNFEPDIRLYRILE
jgi:hypothetical protein